MRGSVQRRLAAVVVNHKTPRDTSLAVRSLLDSDRGLDSIVVVDNDSAADLRDAAASWGEQIHYLHTGANLGFAGGVNAGVRAALAAGADAVLLVNSDAAVRRRAASPISRRALRADPRRGIAAPLLSRRAPTRPRSRQPGSTTTPHRTHARAASPAGGAGTWTRRPANRVAASGCVLLVTREAWERVGLLDERYFFGFEDIDLCLRAGAAGSRTCLVATAIAYHEGGGSLAPTSPRRFYFAAGTICCWRAIIHAGGAVAGLVRPITVWR